jgi:HK97 family phage major capsid protein
VLVQGSYEILEDGGRTIRESLPTLLADARDRLENQAFTLGSGSGAPFGIVARLAATTGSTVTCTTRGTFTSASSGDVMAMLAALPPRARQSKAAAWLAPVGIVNTIRTQTLGTDTTAMLTDLSAGNVPQLLGLPVFEASGMTSATTSGSRPLAVVDLSAYSIVEHAAGGTLQYIPAMFDQATGRPNGTAAWAFHARIGADLVDPTQGRLLLA